MNYIERSILAPICIGFISSVVEDQPGSLVLAVCLVILWSVLMRAIQAAGEQP